MVAQQNIDSVRIGEEIFYNVFHRIFHNEKARKYLKFSQINFFNNTEGLPGWNLWFQNNIRVYQLALIQAGIASDDRRQNGAFSAAEPIIEGRFAVRCFPDETAAELEDFSCTETLLRLGPHFDHTGTPTLTAQQRLDESCFVVGYLDFRTNQKRTFLELECIAPNRWKDVRVDGLYLKTPQNGEYEAVAPSGIDRNIPGWDLAFFIFDKLISGCCYAFQTAPSAAILAHKKWVRFNIDKTNICTEAMDPDIDLFHLVVGLELNTSDNDVLRHNSADQEAYIKTVSNLLFAENFVLSAVCKKPGSVPESKINPGWWSLKDKVFCDDSESEVHHCCYHDH